MIKIFNFFSLFFIKIIKNKNKIKYVKTEPNQIEPNQTELTSGFGSISNTNKLTDKYTQKVMIAWW